MDRYVPRICPAGSLLPLFPFLSPPHSACPLHLSSFADADGRCNAGADGRCNAGTRTCSFADPIYTKPPDVLESISCVRVPDLEEENHQTIKLNWRLDGTSYLAPIFFSPRHRPSPYLLRRCLRWMQAMATRSSPLAQTQTKI
jgi:hypothetical protein